MLKEANGKLAMKKTQGYKWRKPFHNGCASVNDDPHCGRLPTSINCENIELVHNAV
jgi:hypothetical protein